MEGRNSIKLSFDSRAKREVRNASASITGVLRVPFAARPWRTRDAESINIPGVSFGPRRHQTAD
jgi:hypothetical protein